VADSRQYPLARNLARAFVSIVIWIFDMGILLGPRKKKDVQSENLDDRVQRDIVFNPC
jgi:hypothetical protein